MFDDRTARHTVNQTILPGQVWKYFPWRKKSFWGYLAFSILLFLPKAQGFFPDSSTQPEKIASYNHEGQLQEYGTSGSSDMVLHAGAQREASSDNGIVIDDQVRYLGGDGMSDNAAMGVQSRLTPSMKFPFSVYKTSGNPVLVIGLIQGLNTEEAHMAGQSNAPYVSTPAVIKLNGHKISYVSRNDTNIEVALPQALLNQNGVNVLQVDSGYYFANENRIAYDLIKIQDIRLSL